MQSRIIKLAIRSNGQCSVSVSGETVLETVHMDEALLRVCSYATVIRELFAMGADAAEKHKNEEARRAVVKRLITRERIVPTHPKV